MREHQTRKPAYHGNDKAKKSIEARVDRPSERMMSTQWHSADNGGRDAAQTTGPTEIKPAGARERRAIKLVNHRTMIDGSGGASQLRADSNSTLED